MRNPLMLAPVGGGQRAAAIDWALTADFLWHVGLGRRVQLSAAIPVVLAQDGLGSTPVLGAAGSVLGDTALRDLRLEASVALVQRARRVDARGPGVRLDLGLALPIGEERAFQSSSRVTFAPMLVADWRLPQFTFTANLGARLRTQSAAFADFSVGSQGFIGIGVAFRPARTGNLSRLGLAVDYVNLLPFTSREGFKTTTPQEVFVGARYATDAARDIEVFAGGGIPIGSDPLTPAWRLLAGVSYAPRGNDTDGDGVVDADDRCREQPEDRDGYEDEDGCPDPDNDSDGVPDTADRCPGEPEDADGFQDEDGCPDEDNDADGVQDADDQCPDQAVGEHPMEGREGCPTPDTDTDGVLDPEDRCVDVAAGPRPDPERAGCPLPDRDNDGVADRADQCPDAPAGATADRFRPGCPDEDTDRDGVLGAADRCPDQPETVNGLTDDDGCPDTGAERVTWAESGESLRFVPAVVLAPRAQVLPPAVLALVPQMAQRVRGRGGEVLRVWVEVMPGAGVAGEREAARQAELVVDALLAQRIPQRSLRGQSLPRPTAPARVPGARPLPWTPPRPGTLFVRIERRPDPAEAAATPAPAATPVPAAAPAPAATPAP
jgi:OOP family OmpA-OmpF porin